MQQEQHTRFFDKFLEWNIEKMLSSPGEKVLFAVRKHSFTMLVPIVGTLFFTLLFSIIGWGVLFYFHIGMGMIVALEGMMWVMVLTACIGMYVSWYFHVYAITERRILEISYRPLSSEFVNNVLLDQVRCTEIVARTDGLLNHILDMGSLLICFDMPTHEDEIQFFHIASPHQAGKRVGSLLNSPRFSSNDMRRPLWEQQRKTPSTPTKEFFSRRLAA